MKKPDPLKLGAYVAACGYMALWVVASYSEGWPFTAGRSPAPSGQQPIMATVRDTLTSPTIMLQPGGSRYALNYAKSCGLNEMAGESGALPCADNALVGAPNRGRTGSRYAQDSALSMHPAFDR